MLDLAEGMKISFLRDAAEKFLDKDLIEDLPKLVHSLEQVYIGRALGIRPRTSDEEAAARLTQIALALEGELYIVSSVSKETNEDLKNAYAVLARVFEYTARVLDYSGKQGTEYWLRASISFSLADQEANSSYAAIRYLEQTLEGRSENYAEQVGQIFLHFLARQIKGVVESASKIMGELSKSVYNMSEIQSQQDHLRKLGCLNLLEALRKIATYLLEGDTHGLTGWEQPHSRAEKLIHESGDVFLEWIATRIKLVYQRVIQRALWSYRDLLPDDYISILTHHPTSPIIELWASQVEAAKRVLHPSARRHQIIVMPTSAGKTLIAEMVMLKELHDQPGNAFYVASTRALVNEIAETLSMHLPALGITVARIPGDYEFVPTLEKLVGGSARVFVLTPEKLDLLWRIADPRLSDTRVFVFDETQLLKEKGRGLRFELLVSKIRSMYGKKARILMLNAVIPRSNIPEFTEWLGHDESDGFKIEWKPTTNLEAYFYRAQLEDWRGVVHYFAHFNINGVLPPQRDASNRINTIKLAWKYQKYLGPVLVYCNTRPEAESVARGLLELAVKEEQPKDKNLSIEARNICSILGKGFPLALMIPYGIAYHHASLPDPVRHAIEDLARRGSLRVLACTSTLAEGVNLNVHTVIISHPYAGAERMDGARLKNLAGRAGRAMKDTEGHVVVMHPTLQKMLMDEESSRIQSRFFQYIEEERQRPGFNDDIDIVESELLARLYKGQLPSYNLSIHISNLLRTTLFSKQADTHHFSAVCEKITEQAQVVIRGKPNREEQLKVFAETGLNLDFCRILDDAAAELALFRDLNFRRGKSINWSLLEKAILPCLLDSEKLNSRTKKIIRKPFTIIKGWLNGSTLPQIAVDLENPPSGKVLTMLSDYLYGYIAQDVSWACAGFLRLLQNHLSTLGSEKKLDKEWELLPTYLRYGVSNVNSLLLSIAGLEERDVANALASYAPQFAFSGSEDDWIRVISWVMSLSSTSHDLIQDIQENLIKRLSPFTIRITVGSKVQGRVDVDENGVLFDAGIEVGRIENTFIPLFRVLRHRGFLAEIRATPEGTQYLEVVPSLLET